ncbi:hypothetical protein WAE56_20360 [Iodobacter sp. LRB]|uniref:hypothetical protein n=1 Tax=unclassified Iodobacter TaxID=235634 RepID=UPI000C109576|nr:hypothetical protein [Iodobacter sp. BJB302]PHU99609.1 hypothetical protein CSQ88_21610 [Iodobacter sp. BJB302]
MQIFRHLTANDVRLEPFPFRRELSMEAYLIENEGVLSLDDDVFSSVEIVEAELTLKQGRKSKDTDGRIDILATYSQEYIAVIELKLGQLEEVHLSQIEDYLCERDQITQQYPNILSIELAPIPKWIGILVGTTISSELASKLRQGYITASGIPVAALTVQRFRGSDGSVFVTTDTYFTPPTVSKDASKYKFDGQVFGKGRLVLAVVKRYVEVHPATTLAELQQVFPKHCQGSLGVVATVEQANQIYTTTARKRHFLVPEDVIQLPDSTVAVSSQWGIGNIDRFIKQARQLDFVIEAANG